MEAEIQAWLESFARAVRCRDFNAGRALIADDVVGFGTVATRVDSVQELIDRQWSKIWPVTSNFDFGVPVVMLQGDQASVAVMWTSSMNGRVRNGRASIVLRRTGNSWLAIHTHFSIVPT